MARGAVTPPPPGYGPGSPTGGQRGGRVPQRPASVKLMSGGEFRTLVEQHVEPALRQHPVWQPLPRRGPPGSEKGRRAGSWRYYGAAGSAAAAPGRRNRPNADQPQPRLSPKRQLPADENAPQKGFPLTLRHDSAVEDLREEVRALKAALVRADKERRQLVKNMRRNEQEREQERRLHDELIRTAQGGPLTQLQRTAQRFCRNAQQLRRRLHLTEQDLEEQRERRLEVENTARARTLRSLQRNAAEARAESDMLRRSLDAATALQAPGLSAEAEERLLAAEAETEALRGELARQGQELERERQQTEGARRRAAVSALLLASLRRQREAAEAAAQKLAREAAEAAQSSQALQQRVSEGDASHTAREVEWNARLASAERERKQTEERLQGELAKLRDQLRQRTQDCEDLRRHQVQAAQREKQQGEAGKERLADLEDQVKRLLREKQSMAAQHEADLKRVEANAKEEIQALETENARLQALVQEREAALTQQAREARLERLGAARADGDAASAG
eukprot:TRINITY_DN72253_c0_g1_i1.p1 TRINITY_DN72253_c0_g1~~TRINITY_DN72253_c0_g1_i1.p1  ORF type:complete len:561 (+),score=187.38 TRINITY_DN72253_c0_g1_i1:151-1683(+)